MTRRYVLIVIALISSVLPLSTGRMVAAEEWHTAQEGDTLTTIADQHGVPVEALAAANGVDPNTELVAGQDLLMPEASQLAPQTYVVQPGDTLASIAEQFGVSAEDLRVTNGVEDVVDLGIGLELVIPGAESGVSDTASTLSGVVLDGVPAYQQSRSLSCEYASVYIATSIFGNPIYEEEYINTVPQSANPHFGYRGNIDGVWGITDDYGVYAEALVPLLNARGYIGEVTYDPRAEMLQAQLDSGAPVVVWISTRGEAGFYGTDETGTYKLVPYEHVVVAYGYDSGGVYISDPGNGSLKYYSWDWFLPAWSVMDGMALTIRPA